MKNLVKNISAIMIATGLCACNGGGAGSTVSQNSAANHNLAAAVVSNVANQCLNASELNWNGSSTVWYMSGSFKITNSCTTAQNVSGTIVTLVTNNVNDSWIPSAFNVTSFSPWLGASPNISSSSNKNNLSITIVNSYSLASNANIVVNFGYNRNNTSLTMPVSVAIGAITPVPTVSPTPTVTPTVTPTPSVTPTVTPTPTPSATPSPTPTEPVTSLCLNGSSVVIEQKSMWWMSGSFTITNSCNIAKSINGVSFILKSSNSNDSLVASGFQLNSTRPYIGGLTIATSTLAKTIQLTFTSSASINPGASLNVSFGYNPNGAVLAGPFSVTNNSLPPVLNSTLNVTLDSTSIASVCNTAKPCNIKVVVANAEGIYNQTVATITTKAEISSYSFNKLSAGSYTITVQNLANNIAATYTPSATINLLDNSTQNVSLAFNVVPVNPNGQKIVGYFETWAASYATNASDYSLSKMPSYINTINLAFAKPDAVYTAGSLNLSGTGIEVAINGQTLRDAVNLAHAKQQVVLLSVGGATYGNFTNINIPALVAIVKDFNLDGIDLDYEVSGAGCSNINTNSLSCASDGALISLISNLRAGLDSYKSGLKLTAAVWSIGAYGTPTFPTTTYGPYGSMSAIWVNPLKQVGNKFNELYLMSYDAGNVSTTGYDPISALKAYKALTSVPVYLGIEVPPEAWGGNVTTPANAVSLATQTRDLGGAGVMLWALHLTGSVNGVTYTANSYLQPICNLYGLGNTVCSGIIPAR